MTDSIVIGRQTGESNVFPTFRAARGSIKPGVTVYIRGELKEEIVLGSWASGTDKRPVTFAMYPNDGGYVTGDYEIPSEGNSKGWTAPDGTRGFHTPLVLIDADFVHWSVDVKNSQGRGIQLGRNAGRRMGIVLSSCLVSGVRTCPIHIQNVDGARLFRVGVTDGSNFNRSKGQGGTNWSGAIKTLDAWNVDIIECNVWEHWGNVITPSRLSRNIRVLRSNVWNCMGAAYYGHYCEGLLFEDCTAFFTPAWEHPVSGGFVFNNEEEFVDEGSVAGDIIVTNNAAIGCRFAYAIGGNEGETGEQVQTRGALFTNNVSLNSTIAGMRLSPNSQVVGGVFEGNHFAEQVALQGDDTQYTFTNNRYHHLTEHHPLYALRRPSNSDQAREWANIVRQLSAPKEHKLTVEQKEKLELAYQIMGDILGNLG